MVFMQKNEKTIYGGFKYLDNLAACACMQNIIGI